MQQYIYFNNKKRMMFMKNSRMGILLASTMMSLSVNAIMMSDGVGKTIDLSEYLSGDKIDAQGQTILHQLAEHCDQDTIILSLDVADFADNKLPAEWDKNKNQIEALLFMSQFSPALPAAFLIGEMTKFVQLKDNNGDTALDIAQRRNALHPCDKCAFAIELLEKFDKFKIKKN